MSGLLFFFHLLCLFISFSFESTRIGSRLGTVRILSFISFKTSSKDFLGIKSQLSFLPLDDFWRTTRVSSIDGGLSYRLTCRFSIEGFDRQGLGGSSKCRGKSVTFSGRANPFLHTKFSQLSPDLDKCEITRIWIKP
jgi:hypothetical protein